MKKPLRISFASYIKFLRDYCPEFSGTVRKTSIKEGLIVESQLLKNHDGLICTYEDSGLEDQSIKIKVVKTFTFNKVDDMTTILKLKSKKVTLI